MDLASIHYFVISCTGHMENMSSLGYTDVAKVDTFHYKMALANTTTGLKRSVKYRKLSSLQ